MVSRYTNVFIITRGKTHRYILKFYINPVKHLYIEHSAKAANLFFKIIRIELTDVEIGYCKFPPLVMTTLRINILQHFDVNICHSEADLLM